MAREMMDTNAIAQAISEEMRRYSNVVFYVANMAMTERDPRLKEFGNNCVRIAPISVIAGEVAECGFERLKAPIRPATARDTSIPSSEPLEKYVLPDENKIVDAARSVLRQKAVAA
jgi:pyruvate/2-oxoglutarate/acetoin dehydrogenase E1 component